MLGIMSVDSYFYQWGLGFLYAKSLLKHLLVMEGGVSSFGCFLKIWESRQDTTRIPSTGYGRNDENLEKMQAKGILTLNIRKKNEVSVTH